MSSPIRKAQVIAVLNLKGGVGKTHASWLLASVCEERGKRMLAIDLDTQGNLSGSFLTERGALRGIESLFDPASDRDSRSLVRRTAFSQIDFIPASAALARYDVSDQSQWEKADLHLSLVDAVAELRGQYDYIVFDCPPRLSLVSFAALCACDHVIIPMEAADWGAQGIMQVTEAISYVKERFNARLNLLGYLVSRFRRARSYQQTYLRQLRAHFGALAFDRVIPDLAQFEKSVTDRIPITLHARSSPAADIAREFFAEVEERTKRVAGRGIASRHAGIHARAVAVA